MLIEGNIAFYGGSGFRYSREYGIRYHDIPEEADQTFFLCRELIPGYLDGITGVYLTPPVYYVDSEAAEEFDRSSKRRTVKLKKASRCITAPVCHIKNIRSTAQACRAIRCGKGT